MGGSEAGYVSEAFESNYIAPLGRFVEKLERDIEDYTGCGKAVVLSSGTAALHLALIVSGVERGDRVLVSTFTFAASAFPVRYIGAEPVFVDSDESWNADPALVEEAIVKERPKAFVVTHLYGQSAKIDEISRICDEYGVVLIEDSAESLGALYGDRHTGTFGKFGIYSFNGNKTITTGGGGVLVSPDAESIERAKKLSTQAREPMIWYEHEEVGYNYRMSNILAAIGVGQMEVLEERVSRKREIFDTYRRYLRDIPEIEWMPEIPSSRGSRWLTTMVLKRSDPMRLIEALERENIESRPLWKPMHMQPVFSDCRLYGSDRSGDLFSRGVCLPSGTAMDDEDMDRILSIVRRELCC